MRLFYYYSPHSHTRTIRHTALTRYSRLYWGNFFWLAADFRLSYKLHLESSCQVSHARVTNKLNINILVLHCLHQPLFFLLPPFLHEATRARHPSTQKARVDTRNVHTTIFRPTRRQLFRCFARLLELWNHYSGPKHDRWSWSVVLGARRGSAKIQPAPIAIPQHSFDNQCYTDICQSPRAAHWLHPSRR